MATIDSQTGCGAGDALVDETDASPVAVPDRTVADTTKTNCLGRRNRTAVWSNPFLRPGVVADGGHCVPAVIEPPVGAGHPRRFQGLVGDVLSPVGEEGLRAVDGRGLHNAVQAGAVNADDPACSARRHPIVRAGELCSSSRDPGLLSGSATTSRAAGDARSADAPRAVVFMCTARPVLDGSRGCRRGRRFASRRRHEAGSRGIYWYWRS